MVKRRLVDMMSDSKKYIRLNIFWQWIALLGQIVAVFAITGLIDKVVKGSADSVFVMGTAATVVGTVILRFICDKMAAKASHDASSDVKKVLRKEIYDKLLRLGASYNEQVSTSEVVQLSTEGVEQLETYFGRYLPQLFYSLLAPVTLFAVLSFVSFKASLILLICVPLIPISIVAVQKFAKKLLSKYWGIYTGLGDSFLENLQGLTTLKIYQADGMKSEEMDSEAEEFRRITMKVLTMQLNSISVMDVIAYGGAVLGMIVSCKEFLVGNLSLGGALAIIFLSSEFFIPLRLLGSFFHIAMNGMSASDKIFNLLDLEEPVDGCEEIFNVQTSSKPDGISPYIYPLDIEIEDLHFSYDSTREVLKGVNLEIKEGQFVSLVGKSGCGKSTIAKLVSGKSKNYGGSIKVAGHQVRNVKESSLMENVTSIGHDSYIFKGSVRENLQVAGYGISGEDMKKALEQVNLWGFLSEQRGLETHIAEQGGNLSGGQKQRLALARALLHDSPIYIFDEATSNIDAESEELIMKVLHGLAKSRTVLLISHRLANVVDSDNIYMMSEGEIIESGTHDELMKLDGEYSKLYNAQKNLENYSENEAGLEQSKEEGEVAC